MVWKEKNALADIEEEAVVAATALGRLQALVIQLRQNTLELPANPPQGQIDRQLFEVSSEEDQEEDDQEAHANQVRVRSGPRARREYKIGYLNADSVIAELHFEVARIMRRGTETFFLVLNDAPLLGWREVYSIPVDSLLEALGMLLKVRPSPLFTVGQETIWKDLWSLGDKREEREIVAEVEKALLPKLEELS